jgi:hypothetical protein
MHADQTASTHKATILWKRFTPNLYLNSHHDAIRFFRCGVAHMLSPG